MSTHLQVRQQRSAAARAALAISACFMGRHDAVTVTGVESSEVRKVDDLPVGGLLLGVTPKPQGMLSTKDAQPTPTKSTVPSQQLQLQKERQDATACITCGSMNRNWGFCAPDGRYTCHACCYSNKQMNGFYGPLGTRSREEAEGGVERSCAECGTTSTYSWRGHKQRPGLMVCNACHMRYKRAGSYTRTESGKDDRVSAAGPSHEPLRVAAPEVASAAPSEGLPSPAAAVAHATGAAGQKLSSCMPFPLNQLDAGASTAGKNIDAGGLQCSKPDTVRAEGHLAEAAANTAEPPGNVRQSEHQRKRPSQDAETDDDFHAENGGCSMCGALRCYRWYQHKTHPGERVCQACYDRFRRRGTYAILGGTSGAREEKRDSPSDGACHGDGFPSAAVAEPCTEPSPAKPLRVAMGQAHRRRSNETFTLEAAKNAKEPITAATDGEGGAGAATQDGPRCAEDDASGGSSGGGGGGGGDGGAAGDGGLPPSQCYECGSQSTSRGWRSHKTVPGKVTCRRCYDRYRSNGCYALASAGSSAPRIPSIKGVQLASAQLADAGSGGGGSSDAGGNGKGGALVPATSDRAKRTAAAAAIGGPTQGQPSRKLRLDTPHGDNGGGRLGHSEVFPALHCPVPATPLSSVPAPSSGGQETGKEERQQQTQRSEKEREAWEAQERPGKPQEQQQGAGQAAKEAAEGLSGEENKASGEAVPNAQTPAVAEVRHRGRGEAQGNAEEQQKGGVKEGAAGEHQEEREARGAVKRMSASGSHLSWGVQQRHAPVPLQPLPRQAPHRPHFYQSPGSSNRAPSHGAHQCQDAHHWTLHQRYQQQQQAVAAAGAEKRQQQQQQGRHFPHQQRSSGDHAAPAAIGVSASVAAHVAVQVEAFAAKFNAACLALVELEDASVARLLDAPFAPRVKPSGTATKPLLTSPLAPPPPPPPSGVSSCPLRRQYQYLCGDDSQTRARLLGDVAIRWLEANAWDRPLELLLGRAARELGLDRVGPIEDMDERQQVNWDLSRREVYSKYLAVAEAAMQEGAEAQPADPRVTRAAISRFQQVASYLADGLASQLLGQPLPLPLPPPSPPPPPRRPPSALLPPLLPANRQLPLSPPPRGCADGVPTAGPLGSRTQLATSSGVKSLHRSNLAAAQAAAQLPPAEQRGGSTDAAAAGSAAPGNAGRQADPSAANAARAAAKGILYGAAAAALRLAFLVGSIGNGRLALRLASPGTPLQRISSNLPLPPPPPSALTRASALTLPNCEAAAAASVPPPPPPQPPVAAASLAAEPAALAAAPSPARSAFRLVKVSALPPAGTAAGTAGTNVTTACPKVLAAEWLVRASPQPDNSGGGGGGGSGSNSGPPSQGHFLPTSLKRRIARDAEDAGGGSGSSSGAGVSGADRSADAGAEAARQPSGGTTHERWRPRPRVDGNSAAVAAASCALGTVTLEHNITQDAAAVGRLVRPHLEALHGKGRVEPNNAEAGLEPLSAAAAVAGGAAGPCVAAGATAAGGGGGGGGVVLWVIVPGVVSREGLWQEAHDGRGGEGRGGEGRVRLGGARQRTVLVEEVPVVSAQVVACGEGCAI